MEYSSLPFEEEVKERRPGRIKTFWEKYERHVSALALIGGFVFDNFTLQRVDLWLDNLIFFSYFSIATVGILIFNTYSGGRLHGKWGSGFITRWMPPIIQFSFGALFSGFFVFYSRSASLTASWPFLLFLISLLIGNEIFKKRYALFTFQVSIYFVIAFSYAIFLVPVVTKMIGVGTFILSGILALIVVWNLLFFLALLSPQNYYRRRRWLFVIIPLLYGIFNVFYFTNILPPIPLSLKEIGVYHSIVRNSSGGYEVRGEEVHWYEFQKKLEPVFHRVGNESAYVFSAVFAPTKLTLPIFHVWYFYNETSAKWIESNRVKFTINGGRDGGYRVYSFKSSLEPGRWRVDVTNERGQIIGRTNFKVEESVFLPKLVSDTL